MRGILIKTDERWCYSVEVADEEAALVFLGIDKGSRQLHMVGLTAQDNLLVDAEGLLRDETKAFGTFALRGHRPLVGRGLVVGAGMTDTSLSASFLRRYLEYTDA